MMPCGWNIDRIREEWMRLADRAGDARRVLSGARCWIADGSLCSRYGPGVLRTLETFASIVRPEIFGTPDARYAVPLEVGGRGQSTTSAGRER